MKLTRLNWAFERCGISPEILTADFSNWESLPKKHGVYTIWQGDVCIYVGQAGGRQGFRGRFFHHHNKAYAIEYSSTSHGAGWVANRSREDWQPATWRVEYFLTPRAVHRTFIEGAMMLEFDPLCNDENHEDRLLQENNS